MRLPADAIISVTGQCNARCLMCNVWKGGTDDALEPAHMAKLPASLKTINLSGGEPFLRDDLIAFVDQARNTCPAAQITISTNGSLADKIAAEMAHIRQIDPHIRLAVSIDGIGQAHDWVRGEEGLFDRAMRLIELLRAAGFDGLRLSMTIAADNVDQFLPVAQLAEELDLELGVVAAHDCLTHLGVEEPFDAVGPGTISQNVAEVTNRWLRSWRPKQWLRAHFTEYTRRYLCGQPPGRDCGAGRSLVFIQADGEVYSCSVRGKRMGNLVTDSWEQIWSGPAAEDARRHSAQCRQGCWMICTVRGFYRAHPLSVAAWIARKKLAAHLASKE